MIKIIELVKKARNGDSDAFIKAFQAHEGMLYRIAIVYMKNEHDALEVVQEAAYRSFKGISKLKDPHLFKTWITSITINCAKDLLKANNKNVSVNPDYIENIATVNEDIPLSVALEQVMNQLNPEEKTIIILHFYCGYTFREISYQLDAPESTIKSLLYRSIKKLKRNIERKDFYEQ
ncbi:sigma-70 family RNA polymerase sigma factor [Virgibacillus halodenitrificans]|nr:sigma-70 family RNA polymerase sigma factor [Virgibacillus halodenitrificans]